MARGSAPVDVSDQRRAVRLGWYIAELRARLKQNPPIEKLPTRVDNALALGAERSWAEQLKELSVTVRAIATALGVNSEVKAMPYHPKVAAGSASDWVTSACESLAEARATATGVDAAWTAVAVAIQSWDTVIQDLLAERPPLSAGYQLGRGLAEVRWAADPEITALDDYRCLGYLLGPTRADALERLIQRSTEYYDTVTLSALRASLRAWQQALPLSSDTWPSRLAAQATNWHDLVVGDRDGSSFVTPQALLSRPSSLVQVVRTLWAEIVVGLFGALLLVIAGCGLAAKSWPPQVGALLGLLGIFGVSGAGVALRTRQAATGILSHIREKVFIDLAGDCVTVSPTVRT